MYKMLSEENRILLEAVSLQRLAAKANRIKADEG